MLFDQGFRFLKLSVVFASVLLTMLVTETYADSQKVAYINSYHKGYSWSDQCYHAFKNNIPNNTEVVTFYLDSKRNSNETVIENRASDILGELSQYKPDVIVAADDNASRFIIQPHYKDSPVPVVFLGVNVDASLYQYPYTNTTGILESYSSDRFFKVQKLYFKNRRIVFIFVDTTTSKRKYRKHLELYGNKHPVAMVSSISELFDEFASRSAGGTMFIIDNLWGLGDFNEASINAFVKSRKNILIASITNSNKNYSHLIYKQSAREQGGEAGIMVSKILRGEKVSDIKMIYGALFGFSINESFFDETQTDHPEGLHAIETGTTF